MKRAVLLLLGQMALRSQELIPMRSPGPEVLPPPALAGVVANSRKLVVTMSVDRDSYFPGEVVRLTMKALNPTAQIMEAFNPFLRSCAVVDVLLKVRGGYGPTSPHPRLESGLCWSAETAWLAPSQELRHEDSGRDLMAREPGDYRLNLSAWVPAYVDYTVVGPPVTEHLASAEISEGEALLQEGFKATYRYRRNVYAAILRWQSERFLAVTDEATTYRPLDIAAFEAETGEKAALPGPFIRVRQITEPIRAHS